MLIIYTKYVFKKKNIHRVFLKRTTCINKILHMYTKNCTLFTEKTRYVWNKKVMMKMMKETKSNEKKKKIGAKQRQPKHFKKCHENQEKPRKPK